LRIAVIGFHDLPQRAPAVGCDGHAQASGCGVEIEHATAEKAADVYGDPAKLGKQLAAVPQAHDRRVRRPEQLANPREPLEPLALADAFGDVPRDPV
jgi:hypothetical protein